jgi:hypothetical protein
MFGAAVMVIIFVPRFFGRFWWNLELCTNRIGNETTALMADAKERGAMFARKFQSNEPSSLALMELVRTKLWQ